MAGLPYKIQNVVHFIKKLNVLIILPNHNALVNNFEYGVRKKQQINCIFVVQTIVLFVQLIN